MESRRQVMVVWTTVLLVLCVAEARAGEAPVNEAVSITYTVHKWRGKGLGDVEVDAIATFKDGGVAGAEARSDARGRATLTWLVDLDRPLEQVVVNFWADGLTEFRREYKGAQVRTLRRLPAFTRERRWSRVWLAPVSQVGSISGVVVARGTDKPVEGASVRTSRGNKTQTDRDGRFWLPQVFPGRSYLYVTAPGQASQRQHVRLKPRQDLEELKVELSKGVRIVGRVTDEKGQPVPGIRVSTFQFSGEGAYTDQDGRYRLDGVNPATRGHSVHVRPKEYVWQSKASPSFDGRDQVTVDFRLQRGVTVSGVVTDSQGKPVVGASVGTTSSSHMWNRVEAKTDGTGRYVLRSVPPGDVVLSVQPKEHAAQVTTIATEPNTAEAKRDFVVEPGVSLSGRVVDGTGAPVAGMSVGGIEFEGFRYLDRRTKTSQDGTFTLTHLPAGALKVDFYGKKGELRDQVVTAPAEDVTFTLPSPGHIRGRVVDANSKEPITKFVVKLGFSRARRGRVSGYSASWSREGHTFTDPNGHFDTGDENLTGDGGYRVTVIAEGHAPLIIDPVIAKTDRQAERTVFEAKRGRTLRGVVTDAQGQPVAGARVRLFDRARPLNLGSYSDRGGAVYETDEGGEFSIANIGSRAQGAYISHAERGLKIVEDITPALESAQPLRVALAGPGRIEGFVYRGSKPVIDGDVSISLTPPGGNWERRVISLHRSLKTDGKGFFCFTSLPAGRYQVSHSKRWQMMGANVRTKRVALAEGETAFAVLGGDGGAVLSGQITDQEGRPLTGVNISVRSVGWWQGSFGDITNANGKYEIWDLAPGIYEMRLHRFRPRPGGSYGGGPDLSLHKRVRIPAPRQSGSADRLALDITATLLKPLKVGDVAPPFSRETRKGEEVSLEKLRGKVVLLEFWATWHRERDDGLKHLKRVHGKFRDKGLILIGVNLDGNRQTAKGFVREHQVPWPQIFVEKSLQGELPRAYGVRRTPCIFLIDGEGKIRGTNLQGPSVESAATRLLAEQKGKEVQK